MDNTLQVRISADIAQLQSALTKAKNTIKSFESETEKESEKGNVGFKRKIGLIEQLTNKAKALRTALSQATNETQVAKYNAQLEETSRELTRLNALGRSVTANLGSTAGGFGKLAQTSGGANASVQEFGRVIQDAPFAMNNFGSVANNLTRAMELYTFEVKNAGSASKAFSNIAGAVVNPMNLALLAVSAVASAFTLYSMGAFDSVLGTEDVGKAAQDAVQNLEDYRNSLDAVTRASIEGAAQGQSEVQAFQLLKAQAENVNIPLKARLEAVKELQTTFPDYLGNLTQEQILTGNVGTAYEDLTAQIIATAKARAFSDQIGENSLKILSLEQQQLERANKILEKRDEFAKAKESIYDVGEIEIIKEINDLSQEQVDGRNEINRLKDEEVKLTSQINQQIDQGAKFTETEVKAVKALNETFDETIARIQFINQLQSDSSKSFQSLASGLSSGLKSELQILENQLSQALSGGSNDEVEGLQTKIANVKAVLENFAKEVKDIPIEFNILPEGGQQELGLIQQLQAQIQSINALRDVATDPTRIQAYNDQLKALQAQLSVLNGVQDGVKLKVEDLSQAFTGLGAVIGKAFNNPQFGTFIGQFAQFVTKVVAGAFAVSKANAVAGATQSSLFTGPAAAFTLPAFIAGAVGLVASAFAGIKGGGGSASVGSASAGAPPQIFTNSQIPSIPGSSAPSPSGNIDFDRAQGRITTTVSGEDIVFVYDRYQERKKGGG